VNVFSGCSVKKPDNNNKMIADLFSVKEETNEICRAVAVPIMTLKYYGNPRKNISFGFMEQTGLMFAAKDVDTLTKLYEPGFFDMEIRQIANEVTVGDSRK
jgi:hypothetical protein